MNSNYKDNRNWKDEHRREVRLTPQQFDDLLRGKDKLKNEKSPAYVRREKLVIREVRPDVVDGFYFYTGRSVYVQVLTTSSSGITVGA